VAMLLASISDIIKTYIQQKANEGQILNDGRFLTQLFLF
jgi:hypothetical protein